MSDNIASPTPDEKDYKGEMTAEEYERQPESNVGATVERDVDEPNPKPAPENDPNVPQEDTEKQEQAELESTMQSTANQVQDDTQPDSYGPNHEEDAEVKEKPAPKSDADTQVEHGETTTTKQHDKLKDEVTPNSSAKKSK